MLDISDLWNKHDAAVREKFLGHVAPLDPLDLLDPLDPLDHLDSLDPLQGGLGAGGS